MRERYFFLFLEAALPITTEQHPTPAPIPTMFIAMSVVLFFTISSYLAA